MPKKIKIEFCTSCGSKEIEVTGQQYYCSVCDVTFKVTEAGTKVVNTDPLKKQNDRIEEIAADVEDLKGQKPVEQEPQKPKPDGDQHKNEDEDQEPEGFITIED